MLIQPISVLHWPGAVRRHARLWLQRWQLFSKRHFVVQLSAYSPQRLYVSARVEGYGRRGHSRRWEGVCLGHDCVRREVARLREESKFLSGYSISLLLFHHGHRLRLTLIFAISTLYLFMDTLLHFSLKNSGSRRFVVIGSLQDMCSIDPVVGASPHNIIAIGIVFVDRHLPIVSDLMS